MHDIGIRAGSKIGWNPNKKKLTHCNRKWRRAADKAEKKKNRRSHNTREGGRIKGLIIRGEKHGGTSTVRQRKKKNQKSQGGLSNREGRMKKAVKDRQEGVSMFGKRNREEGG